MNSENNHNDTNTRTAQGVEKLDPSTRVLKILIHATNS